MVLLLPPEQSQRRRSQLQDGRDRGVSVLGRRRWVVGAGEGRQELRRPGLTPRVRSSTMRGGGTIRWMRRGWGERGRRRR